MKLLWKETLRIFLKYVLIIYILESVITKIEMETCYLKMFVKKRINKTIL